LSAAATKARNHGLLSHPERQPRRAQNMNGIIYLVGLVVVILAILSFFGLR
jgi:hypothetical protein